MVRVAWRGVATLALAALGASFLSGTGQRVTAVTYPRWQRLAPLPVRVGSDALGVRVGHLVLVLGGAGPSGSRAGASYDVQTGRWHRLHLPVPVTDRDRAAVAA